MGWFDISIQIKREREIKIEMYSNILLMSELSRLLVMAKRVISIPIPLLRATSNTSTLVSIAP